MAVLKLTGSPSNGAGLSECTSIPLADLGIKEVEHLQAWLVEKPELLDPAMVVISQEYDAFDQTSERLDILCARAMEDGTIRLVVVELKRHGSSTTVDIQAIKYAAYVSTLDWHGIVGAFADWQSVGPEAAESALRDALGLADDVDEPLVGERPRIILVAEGFRPEVTATVLWLTDEYGLDIECVTLTAHQVGDETVLATQTLLPLPTAEDFQIRRQRKKAAAAKAKPGKKVDWGVMKQVVAEIPAGHWMTYQDLAIASGGSSGAAMAVGQYLAKVAPEDLPANNAHRVLRGQGLVPPAFKGEIGGPEEARALLEKEGLVFDEHGRADPDRRWAPE